MWIECKEFFAGADFFNILIIWARTSFVGSYNESQRDALFGFHYKNMSRCAVL
jgi:hypothetical protein